MSMNTYKTYKFDHVFNDTQCQESLYDQAQISFYVK